MSKNRMISNELMMALIKYHVLDIKDNEEINNLIISELEEKYKNIESLKFNDNFIVVTGRK